jgi:hypothetical protein
MLRTRDYEWSLKIIKLFKNASIKPLLKLYVKITRVSQWRTQNDDMYV